MHVASGKRDHSSATAASSETSAVKCMRFVGHGQSPFPRLLWLFPPNSARGLHALLRCLLLFLLLPPALLRWRWRFLATLLSLVSLVVVRLLHLPSKLLSLLPANVARPANGFTSLRLHTSDLHAELGRCLCRALAHACARAR